jgi:hypothetical protein
VRAHAAHLFVHSQLVEVAITAISEQAPHKNEFQSLFFN